MRRLQLVAHGEPSDVIELNTVSEPALGPEDVLISMEAAPLNPSDFVLVRGMYEHVYPLEQFKEAFAHSLRSSRNGKILFKFGAIGHR